MMISYSILKEFEKLSGNKKSFYAAKRLLLHGSRIPPHHGTKTQYIYSLVDPIHKDIRYIGQTNNLQKRYAAHLYEKKGLSDKLKWIVNLRSHKLKPKMEILEEVTDIYTVREKERRWIFHYVQQGARLLQGEYFINPYLMSEVYLTKNVDFLKTKLTGKFWQKLFLANYLDSQLVEEILAKFDDRENFHLYEEVRKEYENRFKKTNVLKS